MQPTRSVVVSLAKLLGDSGAPIYVLDEDRQIVYCNAACARWIGASEDDLIGRRCDYATTDDADPAAVAAAALCPPPQAFSGKVHAAVLARTTADGRQVFRRGHFLPLDDGGDESAGVLAILETDDCLDEPADVAATEAAELHAQLRRFRQQLAAQFCPASLLGNSPAILLARRQIELAAQSRLSVLIVGPRGAGKDHAARAIHAAVRDSGALLQLDCATLEANLLRSPLRALAARPSSIKESTTLVLEDVDSMPPEAQADLEELLPVGLAKLRILSTARRPLGEAVREQRFSHALGCALSTLVIELPPLTERLGDLPLLAQAFVEEINAEGGRQLAGFSSEALDRLASHRWSGNVDELRAIVRQSHELAVGPEVTVRHLPSQIQLHVDAAAHGRRPDESIVLEEFLARVERELIERALRRAKGNKSKAARLLGLTRPRLYRRLVQLGMAEEQGGANEAER